MRRNCRRTKKKTHIEKRTGMRMEWNSKNCTINFSMISRKLTLIRAIIFGETNTPKGKQWLRIEKMKKRNEKKKKNEYLTLQRVANLWPNCSYHINGEYTLSLTHSFGCFFASFFFLCCILDTLGAKEMVRTYGC